MLVLLGNSHSLLSYYGLTSSKEIIENGAGSAIRRGLSQLDGFGFTYRLVTFLIWAGIGVVCFSLVQAIGRLYHDFERDEAVSSNRYVHPTTFRRGAFWRQVVLDLCGQLLCLALLLGSIFALFGYILPIALTYTQAYIHGFSLVHLGQLLLGFGILYGWLIVIAACIKLLLNRHRLLN